MKTSMAGIPHSKSFSMPADNSLEYCNMTLPPKQLFLFGSGSLSLPFAGSGLPTARRNFFAQFLGKRSFDGFSIRFHS